MESLPNSWGCNSAYLDPFRSSEKYFFPTKSFLQAFRHCKLIANSAPTSETHSALNAGATDRPLRDQDKINAVPSIDKPTLYFIGECKPIMFCNFQNLLRLSSRALLYLIRTVSVMNEPP